MRLQITTTATGIMAVLLLVSSLDIVVGAEETTAGTLEIIEGAKATDGALADIVVLHLPTPTRASRTDFSFCGGLVFCVLVVGWAVHALV